MFILLFFMYVFMIMVLFKSYSAKHKLMNETCMVPWRYLIIHYTYYCIFTHQIFEIDVFILLLLNTIQ